MKKQSIKNFLICTVYVAGIIGVLAVYLFLFPYGYDTNDTTKSYWQLVGERAIWLIICISVLAVALTIIFAIIFTVKLILNRYCKKE